MNRQRINDPVLVDEAILATAAALARERIECLDLGGRDGYFGPSDVAQTLYTQLDRRDAVAAAKALEAGDKTREVEAVFALLDVVLEMAA